MFTISFNFDEINKKISNMKVTEIDTNKIDCQISVLDKKLVFTQEVLDILDAKPGERLNINYIQKSNEITIPLIGKASAFCDPESGNKLTKSKTLSFKGSQVAILKQYGEYFNIETYPEKPDTFRLIPVSKIDTKLKTEDFTKLDEFDLLNFQTDVKDSNTIDLKDELPF